MGQAIKPVLTPVHPYPLKALLNWPFTSHSQSCPFQGLPCTHKPLEGASRTYVITADKGNTLLPLTLQKFIAKIARRDPLQVAIFKSGGAGLMNTAIATAIGQPWPLVTIPWQIFGAGVIRYGLTYCAFVMALRHIGPSRTGAFLPYLPWSEWQLRSRFWAIRLPIPLTPNDCPASHD
jgi:hypothetical protein